VKEESSLKSINCEPRKSGVEARARQAAQRNRVAVRDALITTARFVISVELDESTGKRPVSIFYLRFAIFNSLFAIEESASSFCSCSLLWLFNGK
jgi:hypothetical protein